MAAPKKRSAWNVRLVLNLVKAFVMVAQVGRGALVHFVEN